MARFKCSCVDVEIGSYDNQVEVDVPPHMASYRAARVKAGLAGVLCVDRCVLFFLQYVWANGVKTNGSCCGHGKPLPCQPFISVIDDDDAARMRAIGFVLWESQGDKHFLIAASDNEEKEQAMKACINCRGPVEEDQILNHPADTRGRCVIIIDKVKVYRCEPCDEMYIAYHKMGPMVDFMEGLDTEPFKEITIGLRDSSWVIVSCA